MPSTPLSRLTTDRSDAPAWSQRFLRGLTLALGLGPAVLSAGMATLTLAPLPATAQTADAPSTQPPAQSGAPLNAEQFDAYTLGRTLSFASNGVPYGIEQYLPDQRVRWAFIGDTCQEGFWFQRGTNICFVYDYNPAEEQCWIFTQTDRGLRGVFQGPDGPSTELYEVQQSDAPLTCSNLDVGV